MTAWQARPQKVVAEYIKSKLASSQGSSSNGSLLASGVQSKKADDQAIENLRARIRTDSFIA